MSKVMSVGLALASLFVPALSRAQYADAVVSYVPGGGYSSGYTDPASALGSPARVTSGQFGGPVDPFAPPFLPAQLVSLGAGGSLTVQFNTPILNNPANPFGVDFMVFGGSGFIITNGDYSGGGITDGSLFGNNTGETRVSVSADNVTYFILNPLLAPPVDGLYPTDGSGDFHQPVDPALTGPDFAGQDLDGIRSLYAGSGGGTGFDISWAQDGGGQSVFLTSISYVRVEVLSGKSEIDGFAVVPEPSAAALAAAGTLLWRGNRRRKA